MNKTIKTITLVFVTAIFMATSSCLNSKDEETVQRTPEIEKAELDEALGKIIDAGYDLDTTELGIYYVTYEDGEGVFPLPGDTLLLEYTGYLLNGTVFDASVDHYPDGIWEYIYKDIDLIPGFDDGLALMNKGCEMDLIIPSVLAYGAGTAGFILPYSTLIFAAKMHDIKPKQN